MITVIGGISNLMHGNECSGPMTIEAVVCKHWSSGNPNLHRHRSFEGYCENIPQGAVRVGLWVDCKFNLEIKSCSHRMAVSVPDNDRRSI